MSHPKSDLLIMDGETASQVGTLDGNDPFGYFKHLSLGYTFTLPRAPRIMAMYDYASGTVSATMETIAKPLIIFLARGPLN